MIAWNYCAMKSDREQLISKFLIESGWGGAFRESLAGDASFRNYQRLDKEGVTRILMDAPPPKEDIRPFSRIAKHLLQLGYSAPRIFDEDITLGLLLLEDFGDETFSRVLAKGGEERSLYGLALKFLMDLHARGLEVKPSDILAYDENLLLQEVENFLNWYLPAVLEEEIDASGKESFRNAWRSVFSYALDVPTTLVLRDFHVDNLMWLRDREGIASCGLLDFQDAVSGPITYDLVSLLEDARRDISWSIKTEMIGFYLNEFPDLDREKFYASWAVLGAQRHAKVIGIFTRLYHRDGKPNYLSHIPRVWKLLESSCAHPALSPVRLWLDRYIPRSRRIVPDGELEKDG
jgi:aminoglycoside/choline kinase family phosphotransferase